MNYSNWRHTKVWQTSVFVTKYLYKKPSKVQVCLTPLGLQLSSLYYNRADNQSPTHWLPCSHTDHSNKYSHPHQKEAWLSSSWCYPPRHCLSPTLRSLSSATQWHLSNTHCGYRWLSIASLHYKHSPQIMASVCAVWVRVTLNLCPYVVYISLNKNMYFLNDFRKQFKMSHRGSLMMPQNVPIIW